jgi:hypothetical protein
MTKWGIWCREKGSYKWERMTELGKELSYNTEAEARDFVKILKQNPFFDYEVRRVDS